MWRCKIKRANTFKPFANIYLFCHRLFVVWLWFTTLLHLLIYLSPYILGCSSTWSTSYLEILTFVTQDCEATDLRALQQGEKVKPHKVVAKNNHIHNGIINKFWGCRPEQIHQQPKWSAGDLWLVLGQLWSHLGEDGGKQHQPHWQEQGKGWAMSWLFQKDQHHHLTTSLWHPKPRSSEPRSSTPTGTSPRWASGDWTPSSTPSSEEPSPPGFSLPRSWTSSAASTWRASCSTDPLALVSFHSLE